MEIHPLLLQEHDTLRKSVQSLEAAIEKKAVSFPTDFASFQTFIAKHFKKKDLYYLQVDRDHRVEDRVLMHDLRNDHAAVVFTIESLGIRLRKNGLNPEWEKKWQTMVEVLLPHLKREEETLFPIGKKLLSPEEETTLVNDIQNLG